MKTPAERRDHGLWLCGKLAKAVATIAPELKDLVRWQRTWELVDGPSAAFLVALTRWEATGAEEDKPPLREAYEHLLYAWDMAAKEYMKREAER